MIEIKRVSEPGELAGIKKLQNDNLSTNLSHMEREREGFVTAEYSMEYLQLMHEAEPSVIAKDGNEVVGYVLASTRETGSMHPLLAYLFDVIDTKTYEGRNWHVVIYDWSRFPD